jgi:hypothetical protein
MAENKRQSEAKKNLYETAIRVLQNNPSELVAFKNIWTHGTSRAAFDFLNATAGRCGYITDTEFNKALDDFFWLVCY